MVGKETAGLTKGKEALMRAAAGRRRTASAPAPYRGGNGPAGWHLPPAKLASPRIGGTMTRLSLTNRYALALAGLLAIAIPVGAQPGKTKAAEPPANRDPYFTPTAAKSTSTMPRVIIRTIREDRAGNIWFATFGGPIRYDGKSFTNFSEEVGLAKTRVFSLLEARSGVLWFGSITGGASRFDGKSFTKFTAKDGLANDRVVWI